MPTCCAMVPKTSPLPRGFPEALTFSGLVRSSFETARTDPCFPLVAIPHPLLYGSYIIDTHRAWMRRKQAEGAAELAPALRERRSGGARQTRGRGGPIRSRVAS